MSPKVVAIPVFIRAFRLEQFFYERWAQPLSERGGLCDEAGYGFPEHQLQIEGFEAGKFGDPLTLYERKADQ